MGNFSVWHWLIVFILLLLLIPQIFYILSLQKTLSSVDMSLRETSPNLVWLMLIPLFNIIWIFFLVVWINKGFEKMWDAGRLSQKTSAGFGVGLGFGISWIFCLIPGVNFIAWIPALVFWILHWIQISQANKLILEKN